MSRSVRIIIALTEEERAALDASAQQIGLSRAAYVRMRALGASKHEQEIRAVLNHEWVADAGALSCSRCGKIVLSMGAARRAGVCPRVRPATKEGEAT